MHGRRWHAEPRQVRYLAGVVSALFALSVSSGSVAAQQPSPNLAGTTLDVLALEGEDGSRETSDWQSQTGVTVDASNLSISTFDVWNVMLQSLSQKPYDIVTVANQVVRPWAAAGALMPLDVCRLSHWKDLFPALRKSDFIRDEGGHIVAVPYLWADAPFIYAPDRVSKPPTSITDLLDSRWRGRVLVGNDPISVLHMLAVARGYPSPRLTAKQLGKVKADAKKLTGNVARFGADYQQIIDLLGGGQADLMIGGTEDMIDAAAADGVTLAFGFFDESHGAGYSHAMAIPTNAEDVDAAYAYIDEVLSAEVNAPLATGVYAAAAVRPALAQLSEDAAPFDYSLVDASVDPAAGFPTPPCPDTQPGASGSPGASPAPGQSITAEHANARPMMFEDWNPPATAEGKIVAASDWLAAWRDATGT